jgi:hypothetical protein
MIKVVPPPSYGGGGPQGRRGKASVEASPDFRSEIFDDSLWSFSPPYPPPYDATGFTDLLLYEQRGQSLER